MPAGPLELERLQSFAALVVKWNRRFNLLSRQDIGRLWSRHIYDSLSIVPLLRRGPVLDFGAGGGFPGLPLAITVGGEEFVLCDRNARKCRFLELAVQALELENVSVRCGDATALDERFATIVSRAVTTPAALRERLGHLLLPGGELIALAATQALETELPPGSRTVSVRVPGLAHPHEVAIIS